MPKNTLSEETPPELAELENGFADSDSEPSPDNAEVSGDPTDLMEVLNRIAEIKQDIMAGKVSPRKTD